MSDKRTPKRSNVAVLNKRLAQLREQLDHASQKLSLTEDRLKFAMVQGKELADLVNTQHRLYWSQKDAVAKVHDALLSYPDRLPRSCAGWGEGNYAYLIECIRAELTYWASCLGPKPTTPANPVQSALND